MLIGENFAQGLSASLKIPLIPINHLEGHLVSPMIEFTELKFPFLCLLVSGGHSMIVDVISHSHYEILGQSHDDAVGEAFDKVGKLLDLPYPGGPEIEKLAQRGDDKTYQFPRPMINNDSLNLSFSGLKTAVLYKVRDINIITNDDRANVAASFQSAVIDVLTHKISMAVKKTGRKNIVIAGGVAANKPLRASIKNLELNQGIKVFYPSLKYCGDNAAMIAFAGSLRSSDKIGENLSKVRSRWPINELKK